MARQFSTGVVVRSHIIDRQGEPRGAPDTPPTQPVSLTPSEGLRRRSKSCEGVIYAFTPEPLQYRGREFRSCRRSLLWSTTYRAAWLRPMGVQLAHARLIGRRTRRRG